jgi:3-deoxy-alpha-D-manno-octulosonate 8-oxidase
MFNIKKNKKMNALKTNISLVKNVSRYTIQDNALSSFSFILDSLNVRKDAYVLFFIDDYFESNPLDIKVERQHSFVFVDTKIEPSTNGIDKILANLKDQAISPDTIVSVGGGVTMDTAKAISNLYTNGGNAEDYQGWDLVKVPGVYKIAVPTILGTGAEATRTCVMTNYRTGLKLGMNSDHTVYDAIIYDNTLSKTVERNQYFWTGMDAYIHSFESLSGGYRNIVGDSFSEKSIDLCKKAFSSGDMLSDANRSLLMIASYLGGCAIATSYVGIVHPLSAGLSVVFGIHHCVANCIVMRAMEEFYPSYYKEFWSFVEINEISIPQYICKNSDDQEFEKLYNASIIHEKPLTNALGTDFKSILTKQKVKELFLKM